MLLLQPTKQQLIFSNIIYTKKQIVEVLVKDGFMSQRSAYRFIKGEKKCSNSYEYACVMSIVIERIEQLQQAI